MSNLVTIYGGSGFVGRYIAQRMAKAGWRVRVAVRRPNEALFVKPYGVTGQVEPVLCNIRDDASVAAAMAGADAVVNCVGIAYEVGKNTFDDVHIDGADRVSRLAAENGVGRLVHISAIGADAESNCNFARSKAEGEAAVLTHMPDAVILRPSAIFGTEDTFFNFYAGLTRLGPIMPIVGGQSLFQPVCVEDVAQAVEVAVVGDAVSGVYELGGPDVASLRDLIDSMLGVIRRRRLVLNMPFFMARLMGFGFDMMQVMSLGLITNAVLTRDQVRGLAQDNKVSDGARGLADLGIVPVPMETVLSDYLWRFRPSGQYAAIKESARNLRT
ncbi:MAG: hypothetical protein ACI8Q6_000004 [Granulosicoccus sp.]|jgi:uncharacterized protein YbjT (DUF2867 family)